MLALKNDAAGRHGENNRHGVNVVRRFLEQIAFYGDKIGLLAGRNDAYFVFYAKLPRAVDGVAGQTCRQASCVDWPAAKVRLQLRRERVE